MRVDRATRHIEAPPERVYAAFTDPGRLLEWIVPEGMTGRLVEFDALAGYRMVLTYQRPPEGGGKASADSDESVVRRVRVEPARLLVEEVDFPSADPAYAGPMRMTWTFEPEPDGTVVTITAADVPAGIEQDVHVGALVAALAQLARVVETRDGH